jgi:hypothetical protein
MPHEEARKKVIQNCFDLFIRSYNKPSDEIVWMELRESGKITMELYNELEPSEISFKYFTLKFCAYCEMFGVLKNNRRLVNSLLKENRERILERS